MFKKIFLLFFCFFVFLPLHVKAENGDKVFKAEVVEILDQKETELSAGQKIIQQNLALELLEGENKGERVIFEGIGDLEVVKSSVFSVGDKVLVAESFDFEGNSEFYVVDYVRTDKLLLLFFIFLAVLLWFGRGKSLRALISLFFTFLVILKYILPQILSGADPLIASLFGSFLIILVIIYLTEGLNPASHIAVVSIFLSLLASFAISYFFVLSAKLTGGASEDTLFLIQIGDGVINLQGLLLAGIIIGVLGVLDDVVISQVASAKEIHSANKKLNSKEIYTKTKTVGISHISSMVNTLFLAYTGASLPLLLLFVSDQNVFGGWTQIINTELVAVEIVRTLAGSIGLILAVPISSYLASRYFGKRALSKNK